MLLVRCRDEFIAEGPEDARPVKLVAFCDGWIHRYVYKGDLSFGAVYRCQKHVIEWGIEWKEEGGVARVAPKFCSQTSFHTPTSNLTHGLTVIEMQGLDYNIVLLIIEEQVPKSERSKIYGCVLDYSKMSLALCKTCTDLGLLLSKNDILRWTPAHL